MCPHVLTFLFYLFSVSQNLNKPPIVTPHSIHKSFSLHRTEIVPATHPLLFRTFCNCSTWLLLITCMAVFTVLYLS